MILPDINILVYAYNSASRYHENARYWLQEALAGPRMVGIAWAVGFGFVRLLSNPRIFTNPARPAELIGIVQSWLSLPTVRSIVPGVRHLEIAERLFRESGCSGETTTDVHLAALAIELDATLYSNDSDFGRFPDLSWENPLK